jgi:hypothetical protein
VFHSSVGSCRELLDQVGKTCLGQALKLFASLSVTWEKSFMTLSSGQDWRRDLRSEPGGLEVDEADHREACRRLRGCLYEAGVHLFKPFSSMLTASVVIS